MEERSHPAEVVVAVAEERLPYHPEEVVVAAVEEHLPYHLEEEVVEVVVEERRPLRLGEAEAEGAEEVLLPCR